MTPARPATGPFWLAVVALALVRVTVPLVALAGSPDGVPWLPEYVYAPDRGDAAGYYAAARELLAAAAAPLPALGALGGLALLLAAVRAWRRGRHWVAVVLAGSAPVPALTLAITRMAAPGAGQIGWSAVLAVPMLPLRALGALDPDTGWSVGLVLALAALAATTAAVAVLGLHATASPAVGLAAAALFAAWPLVTGPLTGWSAVENGQWAIDAGLALYTEPLSTALVTVAVVLVLRALRAPRPEVVLALAGLLLGYASLVRLTNALVAVALVAIVAAARGWRRAVPLAVGAAVWAPPVVAYWPLGYPALYEELGVDGSGYWTLDAIGPAWSDSLLYTPLVLALLLVPLVLGVAALRRDAATLAVLLAPIAVTAAVYSVYTFTPQHPRFLAVALPEAFVLAAAGGGLAVRSVAAATMRGGRVRDL